MKTCYQYLRLPQTCADLITAATAVVLLTFASNEPVHAGKYRHGLWMSAYHMNSRQPIWSGQHGVRCCRPLRIYRWLTPLSCGPAAQAIDHPPSVPTAVPEPPSVDDEAPSPSDARQGKLPSQDAPPPAAQGNAPQAKSPKLDELTDSPDSIPRPQGDVHVPVVAKIRQGDWAQWGGSSHRNNTPVADNIASDWNIGEFDRKTGAWKEEQSRNIKWVAQVGSQTYGNPVVADGRIYIGTNNAAGYLPRYPGKVDLGCLLCFRESDGEFLWQHSSEKLPTGRVHDWPLQGICCAPLVEGNRLWFVTSRGQVVCLDTEGYYDGEDDGPLRNESARVFAENPHLQAGLDDGILSPALRAVFTSKNIHLEGRVSIDSRDEGHRWIMTEKNADKKQFYNIQSDGNELSVYAISAEDQLNPGTLLFQVDNSLTTSLDQGQVSDAIIALCAARGLTVDGERTVQVKSAGKRWAAQFEVNGMRRELDFRRQGPRLTAFKKVLPQDRHEADTVWTYDMMSQLRVSQHNMCSCSVTAFGDILFVNTSNGVDQTHKTIPSTDAPSFMAMDKHTGEVYWTDASPGANILHGQWSSPTAGVLGGVPQVVFAGGDGWIYSFRADKGKDGIPELLWKFDANPKTSKWILGGRGTRNNVIATPVIYEGLVYTAVGQDPEHGDGIGHLWCIDPTKRNDVSPELAVRIDDRTATIPHRRLQAVIEEEGEVAIDNPNSAVVWHYSSFDQNEDGEIKFEETMHRSCGTVAINDDILYIADFSGIFHCLDAKSGKVHWTYDMYAAAWGSPLIVDGKVYIGDEEGDISIFPHTTDRSQALTGVGDDAKPAIAEIYMDNSVFSTPIVANGVLFIANRSHLFAITPNQEIALSDRR